MPVMLAGIVLISGAIGAGAYGGDPVPPWPAQGWLTLLAITCQVVAWLLISVSLPRLPAVLTSARAP